MKYKYPVYQPLLAGNEKKYVNDCLDSTWISSKGEYIDKFETKFREFTHSKFASTVSNGTVAIHLALLALGVSEDDEVIVPSFTYIASVNAIVYTGAKPVFVDCNASDWQIDVNDLRKKITKKTKAIIAVHLYGGSCDMPAIIDIASEYNVLVVEDCAEAFGTTLNNIHVGNFGDIGTFSFFGNKTITTGEGGMLTCKDPILHDRIERLKGQGLAKHRQYWHDIVGYNYRMTNICAAIGLAQIERASEILEKKRKIFLLYSELLSGYSIEFQKNNDNVCSSYWMVSILFIDYETREQARIHLENKGIETRPLFYPVHSMPMYSKKYSKLPNSEDVGLRGINLPSYPSLTKSDIENICDQIKFFLERNDLKNN
jgi:perosamine synthetase